MRTSSPTAALLHASVSRENKARLRGNRKDHLHFCPSPAIWPEFFQTATRSLYNLPKFEVICSFKERKQQQEAIVCFLPWEEYNRASRLHFLEGCQPPHMHREAASMEGQAWRSAQVGQRAERTGTDRFQLWAGTYTFQKAGDPGPLTSTCHHLSLGEQLSFQDTHQGHATLSLPCLLARGGPALLPSSVPRSVLGTHLRPSRTT